MKETDLQKIIRDWVNLNGGFCWRANTGKFIITSKAGKNRMFSSGIKGCSDIIGIWRGKFLAIEVKVGKNKPSEDQLRFLEEIKQRGGIAFVAYSLEDVGRILK